jgi:hypothetical protein
VAELNTPEGQAALQNLEPIEHAYQLQNLAELLIRSGDKDGALKLLSQIMRDVDFDEMEPMEHSSCCQDLAELLIQADNKRIANRVLSDAGSFGLGDDFRKLSPGEQADWHERQADLRQKAEGDPRSIDRHRKQAAALRQNAAAAPAPAVATWQGLEHVKELQGKAQELIKTGKQGEARELLRQAAAELNTTGGQEALQAFTIGGCLSRYRDLALGFDRAGSKDEAREFFQKAAAELMSGNYKTLEWYESWDYSLLDYMDDLFTLTDQLIEINDKEAVGELLNRAMEIRTFAESDEAEDSLDPETQEEWSDRFEELRAKIDAMT